MTQAEPTSVSRKKALLRILSAAEAKRAGVTPSREELATFITAFRRAFAVDDDERLERWLSSVGLRRAEFEQLLGELCVQSLLEERMASRIENELASQEALWSLHAWARTEDVR